MAESPSHKFGQIVGNQLEEIMKPVLQDFCDSRGLYLDVQGKRSGVRKGKKVTWLDRYGNSHDLDFVIEKGGTPSQKGRPVAFIEAAWRRYTKHSRNKAQEIQGAILPIAEEYQWDRPFLGAVLAGVFTQGSLDQLASVGFKVLYFPYDSVVAAFGNIGIDVRFDETTPDEDFANCVAAIEALDDSAHDRIKQYLIEANGDLFQSFLKELERVLDRMIERLIVVPLFGDEHEFHTIESAASYIDGFAEGENGGEFRKYEIIAKFSNGDSIEASFRDKVEARKFLRYLCG
ncbi:MAG: hypothetical protein KDJ98_16850 [Rhodobacteraceae bacterium]|nr:hypothetical protein [Paracoccaceae bacterium]